MSITAQFQKLDDLIIEHTRPPVTAILRNRLAVVREQVEAYQDTSDKQDKVLAKQAETITELQRKCHELESKHLESHKVTVTFKNGTTLAYEANDYYIRPNKDKPETVEFRMVDKVKNSYKIVGDAKWAEILAIHLPKR